MFVENINFTVNAPEDQLGTVSLHLNLTFAEYLLVPWAPFGWGPPAIHLKALVLLFNPPGPPVPLPIVPSVPPPSTFKFNLTAYVETYTASAIGTVIYFDIKKATYGSSINAGYVGYNAVLVLKMTEIQQ